MQSVSLAPDLQVSPIIQGMMKLRDWNLSPAARLAHIKRVMELGITTFDHADIYGDYTCESLFGEALALEPGLRKQMQLISKCGIKRISPNRPDHSVKSYDTSRNHILRSVERSLENLQTDYLDLLLIHRPDPFMNADETADAFRHLKRFGMVRHFGVSNFLPRQFMLLQSRLDFPLVANQVKISVYDLENFDNGTVDFLQQHRIRPMAWSPIAGGRILDPADERAARIRQTAQVIAKRHGLNGIGPIFYAWLYAHPTGIIPVTGTGKMERLLRAIDGLEVRLSAEEWFELLEASRGYRVP